MKKTTIKITIEHENLNLVGLIDQVKGLEREVVEKVIRDVEKEGVESLCGGEYERTRYQRHGSKSRSFKTSVGALDLDLTRVRIKRRVRYLHRLRRLSSCPRGKLSLKMFRWSRLNRSRS